MLNICRGGNGLPGHKDIVFEGQFCPWCKEISAENVELTKLKEELEALKSKLGEEEGR
jgi:hypothetical protein